MHGDVHFVTSTIAGFVEVFTRDEVCQVFVDCLHFSQARSDFVLLAWVLMPNHFHLVLKRATDRSISEIVGNLKRFTSRRIKAVLEDLQMYSMLTLLRRSACNEPADDTAVWKPRFDSLVITSIDTLRQKVEYVHYNPVRKGLVKEPKAWKYSSATNYAGNEGALLPVDTEWSCIGFSSVPSGIPS